MISSFFSSQGWESWDVEHRPLIPERMPVLVDADLCSKTGWAASSGGGGEPVVAGVARPRDAGVELMGVRARAVMAWMEFLAKHGVGLFDSRERLKSGLSRYAEHRATGPLRQRFVATPCGQHMSILSLFHRWALEEGHAQAEPFTYRTARVVFAGTAARSG